MINIRRMSSDTDITTMIDLGALMHAESSYARLPYDRSKLHAYGRLFLEDPKAGVGLLAEDDEELVAMMAGYTAPFYFCSDLAAFDFFLYAHPSRRGGAAAVRLVRAFEEWAGSVGVKEIQLGITAAINNPTAERLYAFCGYSQIGTIWKKEV